MSLIEPDAGWCWFGDPRALFYNGRLYYGWTDSRGWIWVAQVDPATWTRRRYLIAKDTQVDDHDNPSLMVRGGRVCVFWCGHAGPSMRYRVATDPDSVDSFGPTLVCAAGNVSGSHGFTYPNPAQMSVGNQVILLWRGGNFEPCWSRSTNVTGNQWTPASTLFITPGDERPYLKLHSDGAGRLRMLMTDGHPANVRTGVWYVDWHLTDGTFRTAGGTVLGDEGDLPLHVHNLEQLWDGEANPRAWVWDLQVDGAGRPRALFTALPDREHHQYWSASHDGTGWTVSKVTDGGGTVAQSGEDYYSGGAAVDPLDVAAVVLSRPDLAGALAGQEPLHRLERWTTPDDGATWAFERTLTDGLRQHARPFFARGAPAGLPWRLLYLAGTYGDYVNFATGLHGQPG